MVGPWSSSNLPWTNRMRRLRHKVCGRRRVVRIGPGGAQPTALPAHTALRIHTMGTMAANPAHKSGPCPTGADGMATGTSPWCCGAVPAQAEPCRARWHGGRGYNAAPRARAVPRLSDAAVANDEQLQRRDHVAWNGHERPKRMPRCASKQHTSATCFGRRSCQSTWRQLHSFLPPPAVVCELLAPRRRTAARSSRRPCRPESTRSLRRRAPLVGDVSL